MNFKLVPNEKKYYEFIRKLRNNPIVSEGFIEKIQVSKKQQVEYMKKYAEAYRVCLADGAPAGYIGVIDGDIRVAVDPKFQKKGVGGFMVQEIRTIFPDAVAKIKIANTPSIKLFEKAGFKLKYYLYEQE